MLGVEQCVRARVSLLGRGQYVRQHIRQCVSMLGGGAVCQAEVSTLGCGAVCQQAYSTLSSGTARQAASVCLGVWQYGRQGSVRQTFGQYIRQWNSQWDGRKVAPVMRVRSPIPLLQAKAGGGESRAVPQHLKQTLDQQHLLRHAAA